MKLLVLGIIVAVLACSAFAENPEDENSASVVKSPPMIRSKDENSASVVKSPVMRPRKRTYKGKSYKGKSHKSKSYKKHVKVVYITRKEAKAKGIRKKKLNVRKKYFISKCVRPRKLKLFKRKTMAKKIFKRKRMLKKVVKSEFSSKIQYSNIVQRSSSFAYAAYSFTMSSSSSSSFSSSSSSSSSSSGFRFPGSMNVRTRKAATRKTYLIRKVVKSRVVSTMSKSSIIGILVRKTKSKDIIKRSVRVVVRSRQIVRFVRVVVSGGGGGGGGIIKTSGDKKRKVVRKIVDDIGCD